VLVDEGQPADWIRGGVLVGDDFDGTSSGEKESESTPMASESNILLERSGLWI